MYMYIVHVCLNIFLQVHTGGITREYTGKYIYGEFKEIKLPVIEFVNDSSILIHILPRM